ncbi:unnamed protein product [Rotaria sordida]|uniref:Uncharacterized protein n=1 Tax=Rotaria sordida TaxID=392033 RepID=A0A814KVB7_9BILA|nr:unnamed protein product [Rotaria sordida]CAF1243279.1 unnamed protein product [Rotaria sordida]
MAHQPLDNSSTTSTTFQSRKKFSLHYVLLRFDKAFQEAVRDLSAANFGIFLASVLRQEFSRGRQVYRYSSETFINKQQSYDHQMSEQKLKYEKINQVFRRECLVLEKEQSEDSLMQLCQQVESMYYFN